MVKDTTGAVLPGVTVEVASPALIEQVRTATTDAQGQYKILDLRPGTYSVTFALPGFATVKRSGIELPANFTAPVNGELRVGAVEETVTVSGASPVVDVQQAVTQQVLPQTLLDAVPTGGRNIQSVGATLVGVTQSQPDVGGAQGMQQTYLAAHGSDPKDNYIMVDGIRLNGIEGDGAIQQYFNEGMFQEMSYQTAGISAESSGGGVRLNMVPKDGGNTLRGDVFLSATNSSLQANALPADLAAKGLKSGNSLNDIHDVNVSAGGPLVQNRVWFFGSVRHWGVNQVVAQSFYPANSFAPNDTGFAPDTSNQVPDDNLIKSFMTRFTWQVSPKNKFAFYFDKLIKFRGHEQNNLTGASVWSNDTFSTREPKQYYMSEAKWTGVWTTRLLFEAGIGINNESYTTGELQPSLESCVAASSCDPIPKLNISNGQEWGAPPTPFYVHTPVRETGMLALSYVTGSHAIKGGMELSHGKSGLQRNWQNSSINFYQRYHDVAGVTVPFQVTLFNTPTEEFDQLHADLGLYIQDTWTHKRLTLTPGLRWEYFNAGYPDEGVSVQQQQLMLLEGYQQRPLFPATTMPTFKNWAPRFGASYDLFGNGKTALKASIAKYDAAFSTTTFPQAYNPMVLSTDTRNWLNPAATNNIFVPGVSLLGPSTNNSFGLLTRVPDAGITRPYNVEMTVSAQHELMPGVSISGGFYHRHYYNLIYTDNTALDVPNAFTPAQIPNPCVSSPVAGCGGSQPATLTVYKINPSLIGKGAPVIDKNSANNYRVYNGVEMSMMARLHGGVQVFGGFLVARQLSNLCDSADGSATIAFAQASDPNYTLYCDQTQFDVPFRTQVKLGGTYPLPYGFNVSGTFQSYPGTRNYGSGATAFDYIQQTYQVPAALLTPGQATETVNLNTPGSLYLERWNQLDMRFAKKFNLPRKGGNWQVQADVFNVLNSHPILNVATLYGGSLGNPTQALQPRILTLGAQLHF
ncbi:MAG TPA: carboxypeptidase regulatory-like domain-containing protein [Vicinamibacterales bacterium]|nr:carboxypeptidase regulatory-like domain-containing protein [Vicinamibacterales bacterium]